MNNWFKLDDGLAGSWRITSQKRGKDKNGKEYEVKELKCRPTDYDEALRWSDQLRRKYSNYYYETYQLVMDY